MEIKNLKLRNIFLKALPKAVAAVTVTFQNAPFSPGREHKLSSRQENTNKWVKPHHNVPMMKIDENYYQEPSSPKISCMGQIKHKKKQIKNAKGAKKSVVASDCKEMEVKKRVSKFQKMLSFHHGAKSEARRLSDASAAQDKKGALVDRAPHVSQMRRFSSGREALANFDWREEINYYSDEERVESDTEEEEEDIIIPFSAPILVGGGGVGHGNVLNLKPRKEINLWKRRTMAPPRPLQLEQVFVRAN